MPKFFKTHDVFISYVVEDRDIVEQLYYRLKAEGLNPWYAKLHLEPGKDIHKTIEEGLSCSRKGIAVISPDYTSKWAWGELFTLMSRGFIPLIHRMTYDEAIVLDARLSIYKCIETSKTMDVVISEIKRVIKPAPWWYRMIAKYGKRLLVAAILIAVMIISSFLYMAMSPPNQVLETAIKQRAANIQAKANGELQDDLVQKGCTLTSLTDITATESNFYKLFSRKPFHGTITYDNDSVVIRSLDTMINHGIFNKGMEAEPPFGLKNYRSYLAPDKDYKTMHYAFVNMLPVHYKELDKSLKNGACEVRVKYTNGLRYASVDLVYNDSSKLVFRAIKIIGLKPIETMVFSCENDEWVLQQVR